MRGRKRTPTPEPGRRRPVQSVGARPQNFSYYEGRRSVRPDGSTPTARREVLPRSKKEVVRFLGQRFGVIIAIFATIALLITSVQVSMDPRVSIVNNTAVYRIHPDSTYHQALQQDLQSSWANTNKLTINTDKISSDLKNQYPELADVSVALPILGQRPIAYLQLTRPSLLLVSSSGAAFVLDETGRVLAPASQVDNLDSFKLPTVTDQSGLALQTGKLVLSASTVSFIRQVVYQLQAAHVSYAQLTLPQASQEFDVALQGQTYNVRFNTHDNTARQQAGTFLAVQASLAKKGIHPSSYIDVRLPGRAYYK